MQQLDKNNAISLGLRIKALRLSESKSLNAFVMKRGGVTTATLSRVENGNVDVKLSTLIKISSMLNVNIDELLKGVSFDYSIIE